jgi:hypothetical protein
MLPQQIIDNEAVFDKAQIASTDDAENIWSMLVGGKSEAEIRLWAEKKSDTWNEDLFTSLSTSSENIISYSDAVMEKDIRDICLMATKLEKVR